jgi:hypothetical protein
VESLPQSTLKCRVLVRWRPADLIAGVSDLAAFGVLAEVGARFYVHPDTHAKLLSIDRAILFLGSANLTRRGLGLSQPHNMEFGAYFAPAATDLSQVDATFAKAVEIDAQLVAELADWLTTQSPNEDIVPPLFPDSVRRALALGVRYLWVAELLLGPTPTQIANADALSAQARAILSVPDTPTSVTDLRDLFVATRAFRWLEGQLQASGGLMYFGQLTQHLHEALMDDPAPYRADVKSLLKDLLSWSTQLLPERLQVDRPSHSERIRLISN